MALKPIAARARRAAWILSLIGDCTSELGSTLSLTLPCYSSAGAAVSHCRLLRVQVRKVCRWNLRRCIVRDG